MNSYKYYVRPKSGARFEVIVNAVSPSEGKKIVESMHRDCSVSWAGNA